MDDYSEYRAVLAKVDAKFAEIEQRHPQQFACRRGCHSCCLPGLTVAEVERAHIAEWLDRHPETVAHLQQLAASDPHSSQRCAFLDAQGGCAVFAVRPLMCRVHGAPTRVTGQSGGGVVLDVCRLNFAGPQAPLLSDLPTADFVDQQLVATLLYVVGQRFAGPLAGRRTVLRLGPILQPGSE